MGLWIYGKEEDGFGLASMHDVSSIPLSLRTTTQYSKPRAIIQSYNDPQPKPNTPLFLLHTIQISYTRHLKNAS